MLAVAAAAWLGWTAVKARRELEAARTGVQQVQAAWLAGDKAAGDVRLASVQSAADRARALTHDPVWAVASRIPLAGQPIRTSQGLTEAVQRLASTALPQLSVAADLQPGQLMTATGTVDVARLAKAAAPLSAAAESLDEVQASVAALPPSWIPAVAGARRTLLDQMVPAARSTRAVAAAARTVPPMLGVSGTRRYFVGFQNPAETRGTGGLLDAFAIITADHGHVTMTRVGANAQLPELPAVVPGVSAEYVQRYGGGGALELWVNSNLSPDFPEVARAWSAMWQAATGERVDGAVALDPMALREILRATGPIPVPRVGSVDADQILSLVFTRQYTLSADVTQRKGVMLGVGTAAVRALLSGRGDRGQVLKGLTAAADAGHVLLYSANLDEQQTLDDAGLSGAVPATAAPFAEAVVVNAAGSKLDTYLDVRTDYTVTTCTASERSVIVTVTLTNNAPDGGLPEYVTRREDKPVPAPPLGENRVNLQVLLTRSATVSTATLDGAPLPLSAPTGKLPTSIAGGDAGFLDQGIQAEHPSYGLELELPIGKPRTITMHVSEPPSASAPIIRAQPMIRTVVTRADVSACR